MHILHITLGFYPANSWGGPVRIIHEISRVFVRRGHQVTIYTSNLLNKHTEIKPYTFSTEIDGIHVNYFTTWHIKNWTGTVGPFWFPELPSTLEKKINEFDIIHINGYRNFVNIPVARIAYKHKIPYVLQPHGTLPILINSFFVKRIYDKFLGASELKHLDALIAIQDIERQRAVDFGIPSEKIKIIPNALDALQSWDSDKLVPGLFREKYNLPRGRPIILFIGRINKIKGIDMLIEAFAKMRIVEPILVIAGPDDGHLFELKAMVENGNFGNRIFFTGLLSKEDAYLAYHEAKLFVLPSRYESFAMTILEACQANLPMVVTDTCEVSKLLENRIADVVPFNAQAFSDAMVNLLTDTERYRRYQENCFEMMRDVFSIDTSVDKLEALYSEIIQQKQIKTVM
jgi:glycosyltransferase involved in cell wall biosynthesis